MAAKRVFGFWLDAILFPDKENSLKRELSDDQAQSSLSLISASSVSSVSSKSSRIVRTKQKSKRDGATPSTGGVPLGSVVRGSSPVTSDLSVPQPSISTFWQAHPTFLTFLASSYGKLKSEVGASKVSRFPLVPDPFFPAGYYILDTDSVRVWDASSKAYTVLHSWLVEDLECFPPGSAASTDRLRWWF